MTTTPIHIGFEIKVIRGNILKFKADVLALKYSQSWSFLSQNVIKGLPDDSVLIERPPRPGDWLMVPSQGAVTAPYILVVGMPSRKQVTYDSLHDLARTTLIGLAEADNTPPIRHLALTVHGAGWGFDEAEAFRAMLLGFRAAVEDGTYPKQLQRISIVETKENRAQVLSDTLAEFLGLSTVSEAPSHKGPASGGTTRIAPEVAAAPPEAIPSLDEPSVFVAMPFSKRYNDVFYLAIQPAVKENNCQCIRLDLSAYTGDIIETIKARIGSARLMVALLDGDNPNVYLEIGYAWGVGTPTVLIVNEEQLKQSDLPFDVRTQKYLRYDFIYELKDSLTKELAAVLKSSERNTARRKRTTNTTAAHAPKN